MSDKRETRPRCRQANGRDAGSAHIVPRGRDAALAAVSVAAVLFLVLVVPRLMYAVIAPMKGWI